MVSVPRDPLLTFLSFCGGLTLGIANINEMATRRETDPDTRNGAKNPPALYSNPPSAGPSM